MARSKGQKQGLPVAAIQWAWSWFSVTCFADKPNSFHHWSNQPPAQPPWTSCTFHWLSSHRYSCLLTPATWVSPCSSPPKSCQSPGATPTATAGLSGCQNTRHQPRSQRPTTTTVRVLKASPSSCAFACNPSPGFTVMRVHGGEMVRHGKACPKSEPLQLLVGTDLALSFHHMLALCSQAASAPACSGPNLHHHLLLPCAHDKSRQPQSRTPIARASAAACLGPHHYVYICNQPPCHYTGAYSWSPTAKCVCITGSGHYPCLPWSLAAGPGDAAGQWSNLLRPLAAS